MNKKIVSFVLAMVLSVGLGSSAAFAGYSYSDYADKFSSYYEGKTDEKSVTVKVGSKDDLLGGNLTAVFGYYAGTLVSYQGAGGSFQLYDSYGARFSVDNKGGAWNVSGVNLRTSDLAEMDKFDTAEAYLKSLGFSETDLAVAKADKEGKVELDKDGNAVKGSMPSAWLNEVKAELQKGANHSVSVQSGDGMTGATFTVSQDGKAQISYQTDPQTGDLRPAALYVYDEKGFQVGVQTATFETEETSNGDIKGKWTNNYTATTYDKNGVKTETTYQFFKWSNDPQATIKSATVATPDNNEVNENTTALVTSVTKYSANGSVVSSTDYTTNNTTYYANNKPSYVVNAQGTTVGLYSYSDNGVIQAYFNAEGTDNNGNKVGTTTIFDQWGRSLFTATGGLTDGDNPFKNQSARKDLIDEYNKGIADGTFTGSDFVYNKETDKYEPVAGTGTRIVSVNIYADQILDTNNQAIMTNGFIDMNKVNDFLTPGKVGSILKNDLSGFGYTTTDIINMLKFSNGTNTALASTKIANSTWDGDNIPGKDGVTGTSDYSNASTTSTSVTHKTATSLGTHTYKSVQQSTTETKVCAAGITYTNTIMLGGSQAYSKEHHVVTDVYESTEVNQVIESDPAVEGELWPSEGTSEEEIIAMAEKLGIDVNDEEAMADLRNGFYTDESGQTFAIVKADSIHIMDGSEEGFHSAEGETVLVAVDNTTKNKIVNSVKASGDRKVMFMGDVRESSTGYLTMTMNTSYGGGFVQGSAAVEAAKIEISETSAKVASAKYAYENGDMTKEEYDQIVKDAGWIGTNTDENLDKFSKGNFSWDNNKTANENLRDAWNLLLNF
jgi:hypothetical protein